MTRVLRTDYAAVNARGVTVRTFSDEKTGRAWVKDNAFLHNGLALAEVALVARDIYRPCAPGVSAPRDFTIPAHG